MIARLTGILERLEGTRAVLGVPDTGMAYEVLLPAFLSVEWSAREGQRVTLHTLQHLEAHSQGSSFIPRLIGFESVDDRRFFEVFTTVKGVGPRRALRAMAEPIPRIARAIVERDAKALQRLPEIGKRLAETIIAELHGRVDDFALAAGPVASASAPSNGILAPAGEQAVAALVRLGESRAEAERMVRRAIDGDPALDSADAILTAAFGKRRA